MIVSHLQPLDQVSPHQGLESNQGSAFLLEPHIACNIHPSSYQRMINKTSKCKPLLKDTFRLKTQYKNLFIKDKPYTHKIVSRTWHSHLLYNYIVAYVNKIKNSLFDSLRQRDLLIFKHWPEDIRKNQSIKFSIISIIL